MDDASFRVSLVIKNETLDNHIFCLIERSPLLQMHLADSSLCNRIYGLPIDVKSPRSLHLRMKAEHDTAYIVECQIKSARRLLFAPIEYLLFLRQRLRVCEHTGPLKSCGS